MKVRLGFVSNSSSEAFICKTDKTPFQIEVELHLLVEAHNQMNDFSRKFEDVFRKPFVAKEKEEILDSYLSYYRKDKKDGMVFDASDFYDMQDYSEDYEGKVIIYSAGDNTIPYSLFEIIEEAYNATRLHLG